MMRFKEEEICRLIRACYCYQESTGSDYMFVKYQELISKLRAYGENYSSEHFTCTNTE